MKLKKLGLTMFVVLALGAVMASSAFAAATTVPATWRTGSGGTVLSGSETVSSTGEGQLITHVSGTELVLQSTNLECKGCSIENASGSAVGHGVLNFKNVTVVKPSTCAVEGGHVETVPLEVDATYMGPGGAHSENTVLFEPETGTEFTTVHLIKGSGACAISGFYTVEGSVLVESEHETGAYAANQKVFSSGAINARGGGNLEFGEEPAELNGSGTFALSGAKKGEVFGTHN